MNIDKAEKTLTAGVRAFGAEMMRIKWELFFFGMNMLTLLFLRDRIPSKAVEELVFKALLINGGAIHAHGMRKAFFPYIDFQAEADTVKKVMVVAIYAVVITCYARGG